MFKQLAVLVLLATSALAATPYTDCGSSATVTGFQVDDCTNPPCIFVRGSQSTVWINMTSNVPTPDIDAELIAVDPVTGGELELLHDRACDDLIVGNCPIEVGELLNYRRVITIDPTWRPLTFEASFEVHEFNSATGEEGPALGCFTVPVTIV